MTTSYDDILYVVEKAVDQHPKLQRKSEASLVVTRGELPFTIRVTVKYRGGHKRPHPASAYGNTAEEAADRFIEQLDILAAAIK
jgi:hypothetical protein